MKKTKTTTHLSQTNTGASSNEGLTDTIKRHDEDYGPFQLQGVISQDIKHSIQRSGYTTLDPDQREALDMIANKLSRILNGNPSLHDHWFDIAGYAMLIANRLEKK